MGLSVCQFEQLKLQLTSRSKKTSWNPAMDITLKRTRQEKSKPKDCYGRAENAEFLKTICFCLPGSKKTEPTLSDEDLNVYCSLINGDVNEWDLFYWMAGTKPVPEEWDNSIMHSLQKHCSNDKREERFFQPATENSKSV